MKLTTITLLGIIYHAFGIHSVGAGRNLRGINTTRTQDEDSMIRTESDAHYPGRVEYDLHPSVGSGTTQERRLAIHGTDDRREFHDSAWPWRAVGRVRTAAGSCTGTMIGKRLMVTAQHCLNRKSDGTVGWLKFTPSSYDDEEPFGSSYGKCSIVIAHLELAWLGLQPARLSLASFLLYSAGLG